MIVRPTYSLVNRAPGASRVSAGERVHFLHVPKCGGTTVRYILEAFAATRGIASVNEARRTGGVRPDTDAGLVAMGHLPPPSLFRADTRYFTILREPYDRLVSAVLTHSAKTKTAVPDVIRTIDETFGNAATVLLAGPGPSDLPSSLDRAKQTLESRLAFFGFQERFEESLALLAGLLGVDGIISPIFQLTREARKSEVALDERLRRLCAYDIELFDFAQQLYDDRHAPVLRQAEITVRRPGVRYLAVRILPGTPNVDASEIEFS